MIILSFSEAKMPELVVAQFRHSLLAEEQRSVRGMIGTGYIAGTFPWTKAVKALSILFLETTAAWYLKAAGKDLKRDSLPALIGERRSPAAALDSALAKQPQWLLEMFGSTDRGFPVARRLFLRINPELKRPGPVVVMVNENAIPAKDIRIYARQTEITEPDTLLAMAETIRSKTWCALRNCSSVKSVSSLLGMQSELVRGCAQ